jgi:ABC-type Fe3+/spermidine/putrescine transport system ATPase subunit
LSKRFGSVAVVPDPSLGIASDEFAVILGPAARGR